MESSISLLTLGVKNIAVSQAFYAKLGWKASSAGNDHVVFFHSNGTTLALYGREALAEDIGVSAKGQGFSGITIAHNVRTKEEVAQVLKEAERAGGKIVKPAQDVFWGGHSGYFTDPDGHFWEVAWNPGFTLDAQGLIQLP